MRRHLWVPLIVLLAGLTVGAVSSWAPPAVGEIEVGTAQGCVPFGSTFEVRGSGFKPGTGVDVYDNPGHYVGPFVSARISDAHVIAAADGSFRATLTVGAPEPALSTPYRTATIWGAGTAQRGNGPASAYTSVVIASAAMCERLNDDARQQYGNDKQVTVPDVTGLTLTTAYGELRRWNLRVTENLRLSLPDDGRAIVTRQIPALGTSVKHGSTVRLLLHRPPSGPTGGFAVPSPLPSAKVPDFAGKPLNAAIRWADGATLLWSAPHLPALRDASAVTLEGAYRITRQSPTAGRVLRYGDTSHGFRPTPLTLTAKLAKR